jgi:hypothetical protein
MLGITLILRPVFCTLNWTIQPEGSQSGEFRATMSPESQVSADKMPERDASPAILTLSLDNASASFGLLLCETVREKCKQ